MTELYDTPLNFDDYLLPAPSAMRTPTFSNSMPTNSTSYPPNLFGNTVPTPTPPPPPSFPPIVDTNSTYPDYDPALDFFSSQPTPSPPQPSASLAIPFATPSPNTTTPPFLPPPPTVYNTAYQAHPPPTSHFSVPNIAASSSLFGNVPTTLQQQQPPQHSIPHSSTVPNATTQLGSSSTSTINTPKRRKTITNSSSDSPTPLGPSTSIDKQKLEERRRKNRLSSSKCYYNRKKQIELVERTLTDEKKRAIQLYETELKLRQENARLKKELVLKNIRIPPSFMTTTRTEAFTRPSIL